MNHFYQNHKVHEAHQFGLVVSILVHKNSGSWCDVVVNELGKIGSELGTLGHDMDTVVCGVEKRFDSVVHVKDTSLAVL